MRFLKALFALILVVSILSAAAASYGWFWLQNEVAKPGPVAQETEFTVEKGEGFASIADRLQLEGLIPDKRVLRLHARIEGVESDIKAGSYIIPGRASVSEVLTHLVVVWQTMITPALFRCRA